MHDSWNATTWDENGTEMVRVYMFSDSGPYGNWSRCPDRWMSQATSGFGPTPIYAIPADLLDAFDDAEEARNDAENAIDAYIDANRKAAQALAEKENYSFTMRYDGDFYENDEPVEKIMAAWDHGEKGVTAPPPATLWQRFWRSPWVWLLFLLSSSYNVFGTHQTLNWTIFNWVCWVVISVQFFSVANKRWGRP